MIPPGYAQSSEVQTLTAQIRADRAPILITGEAGTGKSTFVRYLKRSPEFSGTVVLAPTGIAALTIGGQTLHSFFRLPPRLITPDALIGQRSNRLWKKVKMIIIDEISMVRPDVLDGIDYILRHARRDERPFGGVKMILVGDFYQLPPVVRGQEAEILQQLGYETPFAYSAFSLQQLKLNHINLERVHRQSQPEFLSLLSKIRQGRDLQPAIATLNQQCYGPHRADHIPLLLCASNRQAQSYNDQALAQLGGQASSYQGVLQGKFGLSGDKLPAAETISLKIGARVMALKNDMKGRWVNGSLGTVTALFGNDGSAGRVQVRFDHSPKRVEVAPENWERMSYKWDEAGKDVKAEVIGTYTQIPLSLAWAVTIHKAQGLTLEDIRIDLERGAFASGQAYVALSRAKTLEGVSLSRELRPSDIRVERAHSYMLERLA